MNFKKLSILLVMALVAFASCSDDDDNVVINKSIVGTWKYKDAVAAQVETNNTANDVIIGKYLASEAKGDFDTYTYTFTSDYKVALKSTYSTSEDDSNGTYIFKDNLLTLTWGADDFDVYTAFVDMDVLTYSIDYSAKIKELTKEQLEAIGITDAQFAVTKALAKVNFSRQ